MIKAIFLIYLSIIGMVRKPKTPRARKFHQLRAVSTPQVMTVHLCLHYTRTEFPKKDARLLKYFQPIFFFILPSLSLSRTEIFSNFENGCLFWETL